MRTVIRSWPSGARRQRTHTRVHVDEDDDAGRLKGNDVLHRVLFSSSPVLPPLCVSLSFFSLSSVSI